MKIPKKINNLTKSSIRTAKNASKATDDIKAYTDSIDDALRHSTKKAENSIEKLKKATNELKASATSNTKTTSSSSYKGSINEKYDKLNKLAEEYVNKERTTANMDEWSKKAREISKEYEHVDTTPASKKTGSNKTSPAQKSKKVQNDVVDEATSQTKNISKDNPAEKQKTNNTKSYIEPDGVITDIKDYTPNISLENKVLSKTESETADKIKNNIKSLKNKANKAKDTLFDIDKNDDNFLGFDIKLKKKYVVPATLALAGGTLLYKGLEINERNNLGEIEAGLSVGTINASFSPTHSKMLDYAQTPEGAEEFKNKVLGRTSGVSVSGADAEIVFALHKLRNGG